MKIKLRFSFLKSSFKNLKLDFTALNLRFIFFETKSQSDKTKKYRSHQTERYFLFSFG